MLGCGFCLAACLKHKIDGPVSLGKGLADCAMSAPLYSGIELVWQFLHRGVAAVHMHLRVHRVLPRQAAAGCRGGVGVSVECTSTQWECCGAVVTCSVVNLKPCPLGLLCWGPTWAPCCDGVLGGLPQAASASLLTGC